LEGIGDRYHVLPFKKLIVRRFTAGTENCPFVPSSNESFDLIKKVLRKYGYPPNKEAKAVEDVLEQAQTTRGIAVAYISYQVRNPSYKLV
jgi:hypothetical protein